ncbi:Flavin-containing monooxygenase FMO GS-OX1 [Terramyces sp. JEL0728]|nr:Flavin-containing monooxygenase FMO GS-OX1 [Terramyces sp. JEL0728]
MTPQVQQFSSMTRDNTVCIIGSGASGLIAAHKLLKANIGFDLFEQKDYLGGVWHYDAQPLASESYIREYNGNAEYISINRNESSIPSALYPSLHTNLPAELMGMRDFPFESAEQFPSHTKVYEYLLDFANKKGITPHIKFNHQVENISGSRVTVNGTTREYDYVIVANGHYAVPKIPNTPGLSSFKGTIMHSQEYRNPIGGKVLVVGGSYSGKDIAREIQDVAGLLETLWRTKCRWWKDLQKTDSFARKERLKWTPSSLLLDTSINDLYLHMFYKPNPMYMFLGVPMGVVPFHLVEYQAELCVARIQGLRIDFSGSDMEPLEGKAKHWFGADREFVYCDYLASLYGGPLVPNWRKELRLNAATLRIKQLGF